MGTGHRCRSTRSGPPGRRLPEGVDVHLRGAPSISIRLDEVAVALGVSGRRVTMRGGTVSAVGPREAILHELETWRAGAAGRTFRHGDERGRQHRAGGPAARLDRSSRITRGEPVGRRRAPVARGRADIHRCARSDPVPGTRRLLGPARPAWCCPRAGTVPGERALGRRHRRERGAPGGDPEPQVVLEQSGRTHPRTADEDSRAQRRGQAARNRGAAVRGSPPARGAGHRSGARQGRQGRGRGRHRAPPARRRSSQPGTGPPRRAARGRLARGGALARRGRDRDRRRRRPAGAHLSPSRADQRRQGDPAGDRRRRAGRTHLALHPRRP